LRWGTLDRCVAGRHGRDRRPFIPRGRGRPGNTNTRVPTRTGAIEVQHVHSAGVMSAAQMRSEDVMLPFGRRNSRVMPIAYIEHQIPGRLRLRIFTNRRMQLAALAPHHRIPAIYQWNAFVAAGGLISYGADLEDVCREAGHYTARVLQGEWPAELPLQQPTKFQLAINLKVAGDLGLTIPPALLALPTRSSNDPPRPHRAPREHSGCVAASWVDAAARGDAARGRANERGRGISAWTIAIEDR
jgi:ABC transporter substrate binding protein